jgi:hypothetical protein
MQRLQSGLASILLSGMLVLGVLARPTAWGQTSPSLQQVEEQLREQHMAAEAHHQQMQGINDPEQLSVETRRHFRMTEEILALMLERRKLMAAQAMAGSTPERGASGGHLERHVPSSQPGSRMPEPPVSGPARGAPGGHLQRHDKAPEQGSELEALEQMLQQISEHSAYMDTLQDRAVLAQEMFQHQKMLDQMFERLQQ